jgi:hypothetical protein
MVAQGGTMLLLPLLPGMPPARGVKAPGAAVISRDRPCAVAMPRALPGLSELMKSLMSTSSFLWSFVTLQQQQQQQHQQQHWLVNKLTIVRQESKAEACRHTQGPHCWRQPL